MPDAPEQGHSDGVSDYQSVTESLRLSYDRMAVVRDATEVDVWKVAERWRFLELLQNEERRSLLEVGAGPGLHGKFFQEQGLEVVCTDLSPEHVRLCREKGLTAYEVDFMGLAFSEPFDAVFAMNCLLHVPRIELPAVLERIAGQLRRTGLFYLGQYGGAQREGVSQNDHYEPKRFYSFLSDDSLRAVVRDSFIEVDFRTIDVGDPPGWHYQALILRKP